VTVKQLQSRLDQAYARMIAERARTLMVSFQSDPLTPRTDDVIEQAVDEDADSFVVVPDNLRLILGCSRNLYDAFSLGAKRVEGDAIVVEMAMRAYVRDLLDAIADISDEFVDDEPDEEWA
jgi:hypothetical protein